MYTIKCHVFFTAVERKLYLGGGGGMTKKISFRVALFQLRLQKQFSGKWGPHAPPAPRFLRHCFSEWASIASTSSSFETQMQYWFPVLHSHASHWLTK